MTKHDDVLVWWEDEDLSKEADLDLGENSSGWVGKIQSAFEQSHRELLKAGGEPSLSFSHKDFVRGYALGAITITVNSKYLVFPVVVRNGKLAPFDTVYVDKHWHFADKDLMAGLAHGYNLFLGEEERSSYGAGDIRWNRFNYGTQGGKVVLSHLLPISESVREKIASFIEGNPAKYANATKEFKQFIKKIAAKKEMIREAKLNPNDFDIMGTQCLDINKYRVKFASHGCNGSVSEVVDANGVREYSSFFTKEADKLLAEADTNPSKMVIIDRQPSSAAIPDPVMDAAPKPGAVSGYGTYDVLFESGLKSTGVVFPLIEWSFKNAKKFLYMDNENWAVQQEMVGHPASKSMRMPRGNMSSDSTGVFVYEKSGRAFATPPFEIKSIFTSDEGVRIGCVDLMSMRDLNLVVVPGIKAIMTIDPEEHPDVYKPGAINVYIPAAMEYVELPMNRTKIIHDPQSVIKVSSIRESFERMGETIKFAKRSDDNFMLDWADYDFVEYPTHIKKLAGFEPFPRISHPGRSNALMSLIVAGAKNPKGIIKSANMYYSEIHVPDAKTHSRAKLYTQVNYTDDFAKKASPMWGELYQQLPSKPNCDIFLKVAAKLEDETTIDKLFNLSFFDKDNLGYFVSHKGLFNEVEEVLTKLLLSTRVSNTGIVESDILTALEGLSEIQEGLKGLELKSWG